MKKILQLAALALFVITVGSWVATGNSTGWTKTSVTEMQMDDITGLEFPVEKDTLIIGVEILGVGILASAALLGLSFIPKLNKQ